MTDGPSGKGDADHVNQASPVKTDAPDPFASSKIMGGGPRVEFLDRAGYRQRRFRDAARLLPVIAAVLMILPLMWPRDTPSQSLSSNGMIYLFGLWFVLIVFAFGLARVLRFSGPEAANGEGVKGPDE